MEMEIDVERSSISKLRVWRFVEEQPTWSDCNSKIIRAHRQQVAEHDRKVSPVYFRGLHPPYYRNQMRQRFILTNEPISDKKCTPKSKISSSPEDRKPTAKPSSRMSTPISLARHLAPASRLLQRRPLVIPFEPLSSDDNYFHALADEIDLRPITFDRHAKSVTFYSTHYPLILTQYFGKERAKSVCKGRTSSLERLDEVVERKMYLNDRLQELETMVDRLEEQTEDVQFNTELRSNVFNPIEWQFVKIDPISIYRRYTMEMLYENHIFDFLAKHNKSKCFFDLRKKRNDSCKIFE